MKKLKRFNGSLESVLNTFGRAFSSNMFLHYNTNMEESEMTEELKALLQQFLADEVELLEDVSMDVDNPDASNRVKAVAIAHYAAQVARVGAIRDVLELVCAK